MTSVSRDAPAERLASLVRELRSSHQALRLRVAANQFKITGERLMAMDIPTLRKLVALDENDALSRFALGRKLAESATTDSAPELAEAAEHLMFSNRTSPDHLATYRILSEVLIRLNRKDEAREVLKQGIRRVAGVGEGMGRDLGPAMQQMLDSL